MRIVAISDTHTQHRKLKVPDGDVFYDSASGIEDIVRQCVREKLNFEPARGEYDSWRNSLGNEMHHVMNTAVAR